MQKSDLMNGKDRYEREGYLVYENVLDEELVKESREHLDWVIAKHPDTRPERLGHDLVANDPFWLRLISDERLLNIAETFIGPNIALFASGYLCKPPFDGKKVLWHQDGSYWPLSPMEVVTLWLAIDESTPENGCLRVIPGTHKLAIEELKEQSPGEDAVLGGESDPDLFDASKAVDIILKPGDVSVHHPNIIHGSEPNRSPKRRGGLLIRYIPTTTLITAGTSEQPWPCAFHFRGDIIPGINSYLVFPKYVEGEHFPFRGSENWK